MNITYFSRNSICGYSIRKVFAPIIAEVSKQYSVEAYDVPWHRAAPISIFKNLWFVFRHRNKKGINHITGDIHYCMLALIGCKSVLTIHDLGFIHNELDVKNKLYTWYRKILWIYIPTQIADRITCISDKTAEILKSYIPKHQHKKITVIYNPVDPRFAYSEKKSFNAKPVILHLGTKSNKNLERVILALKDVHCALHIIGNLNEFQKKLLLDNHIEFKNEMNLSNDDLVARYAACDIVSFPSLYEGFGMPIIEAQGIGRVVLTSNIAPMNLVAGKGAILVDPTSIDSIRDGFITLIDNNEKIVEQLINDGIMNVTRFEKQFISEEYIKVYYFLNSYLNQNISGREFFIKKISSPSF